MDPNSCPEEYVATSETVHPQDPWLMLPRSKDDEEKGWIYFYSIFLKKDFSINIPSDGTPLRWTNCLNSSGKWLMVLDEISNLHMLNPITGAHIPLPPLTTFEDVRPVYSGGRIIDYVLRHNGLLSIRTPQEAGIVYFNKAIVGWTNTTTSSSTSTYTVLAITEAHKRRLAFTRQGDRKWTSLMGSLFDKVGTSSVDDIIYHKGRFLVLHSNGTICACDFRGVKPNFTVISDFGKVKPKFTVISESLMRPPCQRSYLVQLSSKFFQVLRYPDYSIHNRDKTLRFEVHKLVHRKWVEVKDLEGHSLFVGKNNSFSIPARCFPSLKGNCIYFSDEYIKNPSCPQQHLGIFNVEDGSFSTYFPDPDESQITWPLPVWFMPNLLNQSDQNLGKNGKGGGEG